MTKIFFDSEFTGLHKGTTLISLGMASDCGKQFYAEFTDYDNSQVDDWITDNVINNLHLNSQGVFSDDVSTNVKGDTTVIKNALIEWITQFANIEMWSDCLSFDWVLLNDLIANYSDGYPNLPSGIGYIPFDICTVFKLKGVDPDISREDFSGIYGDKHNALYDAKIIKACYEKLFLI